MSSSSCGHDIEELLHKRADTRLSLEETAALERLVGSCAACRDRAALLEWASQTLRAGRRAVPVGFADRVLRRVAERGVAPRVRERPAASLRWLPAAVTALAAGLVMVTL